MKSSTTEESVGCRCFANAAKGMAGIIKHLYSDFHVHEIDQNGIVVYLKSLDPEPEPEFPPGFIEFTTSNSIFFKFEMQSESQVAKIYTEYPSYDISVDGNKVTIEKTSKRMMHPVITGFVLCKENVNQQEALGRISKKTGKQKKNIGFAGNKDKRAITTQICTIRDLPIFKLQEVQNVLGDNIMIGHFYRAMNPISLGDLSGNRFTIVLREISLDDKVDVHEGVQNKIEALKESGFLNYFGMQRFGTGEIPTHHIGAMIIRREWPEIIYTLLEPHKGEQEQIFNAKTLYKKSGDAKAALKLLPRSAQAEQAILKTINDLYQGKTTFTLAEAHEIFKRVDRRQRMMYVHAYQSYLWNHMVSSRWEEYGSQLVVGDWVLNSEKQPIKIDESNINQYGIFDVVIPLPNANMELNNNVIQLMRQDNVTLDLLERLSSEYGAKGDWRPLLAKANDIEWEIIKYNDRRATLVDSDIDKLNGVTYTVNHDPNGQYTALSISFSLGSGQYATMCLRELLKRTTEWWTDSNMSQKHSWIPDWCTNHCTVA